MPTVIDSLIVEFGLDPSKFTKGQQEVIDGIEDVENQNEKSNKNIQKSGKETAAVYSKIRNELIGLVAVFTGGKAIKEFVTDTVNTNAALGRLAPTLRMSVSNLSAWLAVAERAGGSADATAGSFNSLMQSFQQFQLTGESSVIPFFRALQIQISDASGKLRPLDDIMLDLADRFKGMDPARAAAFGQGLGLDSGTINLLRQGREAVRGMLAEQEKIGHASDKDSKAAAILQEDIRELGQASSRTGTVILTDLTPALDALLKKLIELSEWFTAHPAIAEGVLGIGAAGGAIGAWKTAKGLFGKLFGGGGAAAETAEAATAAAASDAPFTMGGIIAPAAAGALAIGSAGAYAVTAPMREERRQRMLHPAGNLDPHAFDDLIPGTGASGDKSLPRGIRNNNPGNLNFVGQPGAGTDGRFATFGTMQEGIDALNKQLARYFSRGLDTVRKIINKYAPSFENNTPGYINSLAKSMGVDPDQHLTPDRATFAGLDRGIIGVENGPQWAQRLTAYLESVKNGTSAGAGLAVGGAGNTNNTSHSEVHIGSIDVHTKATDAKGIAGGIADPLGDRLLAMQANTGMS